MKLKIIIAAICLSAFSITAIADGQRVPYEQIPNKAKEFISKHMGAYQVLYAEYEREGGGYEYEVKFMFDADITFDSDGNWTTIDPGHKRLPQSILSELPKPMADYLTKKYSLKNISEIQRWHSGYEVEIDGLFDDFDLYFDASGNFIGKKR